MKIHVGDSGCCEGDDTEAKSELGAAAWAPLSAQESGEFFSFSVRRAVGLLLSSADDAP